MKDNGPGSYQGARVITWLGVPFIILAFLVVVTLQRGDARKNLSRVFLESAPMNLLGYVSYPMCTSLFQVFYDNSLMVNYNLLQIFCRRSLLTTTARNGHRTCVSTDSPIVPFGDASWLPFFSSLSAGWSRNTFRTSLLFGYMSDSFLCIIGTLFSNADLCSLEKRRMPISGLITFV